jgi:hypothetical protein
MSDFGLGAIAAHFGKSEALLTYQEGQVFECDGDFPAAVKLYKRAFRLWPALDSLVDGGIPKTVREETEAAGLWFEGMINSIDMVEARESKVMHCSTLLAPSDLNAIDLIQAVIKEGESALDNNPQNSRHHLKVNTMMNNPPDYPMQGQASEAVNKMLAFAAQAWDEAGWGCEGGPLEAIAGGVPSLSIRLVESWDYSVGGGLIDDYHHDTDSVLTLVVLLSHEDDYEGGVFRTNEVDDVQLEHPMCQGDCAVRVFDRNLHSRMPLSFHVFAPLEARLRVPNDIPLGWPLPLTVTTVNPVQTRKAYVS